MNQNDPRVKRTRQLLQQALMDLLQEKGFQAITVQDIAERATLNRATFYAHFTDKYDLIDNVMREGLQRALSKHVPTGAAFSTSTLRTICRTVFEFMGQVQAHCLPGDEQVGLLFDQAVQEVLQSFLARRLIHLPTTGGPWQASRETLATLLSWAIFGVGVRWSRGPRAQSADDIAGQVVAALRGGIAAALAEAAPDRHTLAPAATR